MWNPCLSGLFTSSGKFSCYCCTALGIQNSGMGTLCGSPIGMQLKCSLSCLNSQPHRNHFWQQSRSWENEKAWIMLERGIVQENPNRLPQISPPYPLRLSYQKAFLLSLRLVVRFFKAGNSQVSLGFREVALAVKLVKLEAKSLNWKGTEEHLFQYLIQGRIFYTTSSSSKLWYILVKSMSEQFSFIRGSFMVPGIMIHKLMKMLHIWVNLE